MLRNFFSIAEEFIYTSTLCWFFGGKGGRRCVGVGGGQGECVGVGVRVEGGCRRGGGGACQIGVGVGVNPTHPFGISLSTVTIGALSAAYTKFPLSRSYVSPRLLSFRPPLSLQPTPAPRRQPPPQPPHCSPPTQKTTRARLPAPTGGGIKGGEENMFIPHPPTPGRARRSTLRRSIFKDGCVVENLENGSDSDELRQDRRRSDRRDICQVSGGGPEALHRHP